MNSGTVAALGPVGEILARADLAFAAANQAGAVLSARIVAHDPERQLTKLDAGGAAIWIPAVEEAPGSTRRIRVPASEVVLSLDAPGRIGADNVLAGRVRAVSDTPDHRMTMVEVEVGNTSLLSQLAPDVVRQLKLAPGVPVTALFKSIGVQVL